MVEIVTEYIALDRLDKAESAISQENSEARGRILYGVLRKCMRMQRNLWTGNDESSDNWTANPAARKIVEFVASMAPVNHPESDCFLATLLARAHKELSKTDLSEANLSERDKAIHWLDIAVKAWRLTNERTECASAPPAKSVQVSATEKTRTAPEKVSSGRVSLGSSIVLSVVLAAIGFVLAVILKPGLEAFGKCVVGKAIADITRNPEILRHLDPGGGEVSREQATGNSKKDGPASIRDEPGSSQGNRSTPVT